MDIIQTLKNMEYTEPENACHDCVFVVPYPKEHYHNAWNYFCNVHNKDILTKPHKKLKVSQHGCCKYFKE